MPLPPALDRTREKSLALAQSTVDWYLIEPAEGITVRVCLLIIVTLLSVFMVACVQTGSRAAQDPSLVSTIQVGVTTQEDVRLLLGPPNDVVPAAASNVSTRQSSNDSKAEIWIYVYMNENPGFLIWDAKFQTGSVSIAFDENGVVQHVAHTESDHIADQPAVQDDDAIEGPSK